MSDGLSTGLASVTVVEHIVVPVMVAVMMPSSAGALVVAVGMPSWRLDEVHV